MRGDAGSTTDRRPDPTTGSQSIRARRRIGAARSAASPRRRTRRRADAFDAGGPSRLEPPEPARPTTPAAARDGEPSRIVKLAVVVQRYGADISGGAELHARYIAELLARRHSVEVLTTCAHDYVTWRAQLPGGHRDRQRRDRAPLPGRARARPARTSAGDRRRSSSTAHSIADEIAWLESEGPTSPALIEHIGQQADAFDFVPLLQLSLLPRVARHARACRTRRSWCRPPSATPRSGCRSSRRCSAACAALMYNSHEERAMIQARLGQHVGARRGRRHRLGGAARDLARALPAQVRHPRARSSIYVGRIDENKGCRELFDYFTQLPAAPRAAAVAGADRHVDPADSRAPARAASRLRLGPRQVRRASPPPKR